MRNHLKPLNKNNLNKKALTAPQVKEKRKQLQHIYNSKKWKELRNNYISLHPICECCNINESRSVHHIQAFSSGKNKKEMEKLAYDESNLMALCFHCHLKKHNHD